LGLFVIFGSLHLDIAAAMKFLARLTPFLCL
jgi:hypothetical protein